MSSSANGSKMPRAYTSKQFGDACEMLVAAELTLAGVPALTVPDSWPGYDIIAQPVGSAPQRISVKARTNRRGNFIVFHKDDQFDWLAVVLISDGPGDRQIYIIPREVVDAEARRDRETAKTAALRYFTPADMEGRFHHYLGNFQLASAFEERPVGCDAANSGSLTTLTCGFHRL